MRGKCGLEGLLLHQQAAMQVGRQGRGDSHRMETPIDGAPRNAGVAGAQQRLCQPIKHGAAPNS